MNVARTAEYFARTCRALDWLVEDAGTTRKFDITIRRPGSGEIARLYMESDDLDGLHSDLIVYLGVLGIELEAAVEGE